MSTESRFDMDNEKIQAAIRYNKRQGYSPREVEIVQRVVGSGVDGQWGPKTVKAVVAWQTEHGLKVDGKVGTRTWARINDELEAESVEVPAGRVVEVGCGLAAYSQKWPEHTPQQALQVAWDAALAEGVKELRYWSSEWLIAKELPGGGYKGNRYSGPWLESQTVPEGVVVGAWIDNSVKTARSDAFIEQLRKRHIRRAALMINRCNTRPDQVPWALRWEIEDLECIAKRYGDAGIDIVCTCWPRPAREQIDAMIADMSQILPIMGNRKIFEVDTEGNWTKKFLHGFCSMRDAAKYLADAMRSIADECELTTYSYHQENSRNAHLAPLMDRLLPQAYSVSTRNHEPVDWEGRLGPGRHQRLAIRRARKAAAAEV